MERTYTITHNGVDYVAQAATIEGTYLGVEDHGIFTADLRFKGVSWGQGTGGICLDEPICDEQDKFLGRIGTAEGMTYIMRLLWVCGVSRWESLPGLQMILLRQKDVYGQILGLAHPIEDRVFILRDHFFYQPLEPLP